MDAHHYTDGVEVLRLPLGETQAPPPSSSLDSTHFNEFHGFGSDPVSGAVAKLSSMQKFEESPLVALGEQL